MCRLGLLLRNLSRMLLFALSTCERGARITSERSPRQQEAATPKTSRSSTSARNQKTGGRPDRSHSPRKKDRDRARASPLKSPQRSETHHQPTYPFRFSSVRTAIRRGSRVTYTDWCELLVATARGCDHTKSTPLLFRRFGHRVPP